MIVSSMLWAPNGNIIFEHPLPWKDSVTWQPILGCVYGRGVPNQSLERFCAKSREVKGGAKVSHVGR